MEGRTVWNETSTTNTPRIAERVPVSGWRSQHPHGGGNENESLSSYTTPEYGKRMSPGGREAATLSALTERPVWYVV